MDTQKLKDKILQLAIQGKLVEQDPSDEPASELLKKIETEKKKLYKEGEIRKPKRLPPIKEEEKPFDIPESWEWVRWGEICSIRRGASPRPIKKYVTDDENGVNWIKIGDADKDKYITKTEQKITKEGSKKSVFLEENSLIMSNSMSFGKAYILKIDGCVHDGWLTFRFNNDLLFSELLLYFLNGSYDKFKEKAVGTGVKNLNTTRVKETLVPLPPLYEQKRIVEKIDGLFKLIDNLDTDKKKLLETIELTRNKVLQDAIQGKLVEQDPNDEPASELLKKIEAEKKKLYKDGKIRKPKKLPPIKDEEKPFDIPENWEWVRLGEIFLIIRNGANIKQNKSKQEGYPITRIETISNADFDRNKMGYGNIKNISKYEKYVLKEGDILMSHINSVKHLGKTAYYEKLNEEEIIIHGMNLLCLRSDNKSLNYRYSDYYFKSSVFYESIQDIIKKAVNQASINITNLSNKTIPLPPINEQKRIVEKIDSIFDSFEVLEKYLDN